MEGKSKCAFVTLATDDNYGRGALVLAHSLRLVDTKHSLVILVTSAVSSDIRSKMSQIFDVVKDVNVIDSEDDAKLALMKRPELGVTFTKLHCWRLTEFSKCVFLDADTLVFKNCDELFEKDELSAVPDVGWPDCFNSGVFVFKPSIATYKDLLKTASEEGSFDGGDQGLLNVHFKDWRSDVSHILSFIYNMSSNSTYSYLPAYKKFGDQVKIVHFLGSSKPWMQKFDKKLGPASLEVSSNHVVDHMLRWWEIYVEHVEPEENVDMSRKSLGIEELSLSSHSSPGTSSAATPVEPRNSDRREAWEHGQIDYMGQDSFDKIQKKLDESISDENGDDKKDDKK